SLLAVSSPAELSKAITRCLTGSLRSRFSFASTHRLVFLLLTLQIPRDERGEVKQSLSISAHSLLRSFPLSPPDFSSIAEPADGLLTAHPLFHLLVSPSQFVPTFLPSGDAADAADKEADSGASLQLALLHLLYLLFAF